MAKICAVVLNSVSRDARVLKEAESLAMAGHEVTIVGVVDKNFSAPYEQLPSGVKVYRLKLGSAGKALDSLFKAYLAFTAVILSLFATIFTPTIQQIFGGLTLVAVAWLVFSVFQFFSHIGAEDTSKKGLALLHPRELFTWLARQVWASRLGQFIWFEKRLRPICIFISDLSPDVIHCHDVHTLPIGLYIKRRSNCKLVYDAHEIYEEIAQNNGNVRQRYKRIHVEAQRIIDYFITINDSIAQWYSTHYPKFPKGIVLMNATRLLDLAVAYDGRLHKAAGLSLDTRILLYQGGFATHRGLETLVRNAQHLPSSWCLVMMGWGTYEGHLRGVADEVNKLTRTVDAESRVRFIPPAPHAELAAWTSGATIGVIPYENSSLNHWFCTPNKLWEYPVAGVPLLVSPFPEMQRQIERYGHGWLLPLELLNGSVADAISALTQEQIAVAKKNTETFIAGNHWGIYEKRLLQMYEDIDRKTVSQES